MNNNNNTQKSIINSNLLFTLIKLTWRKSTIINYFRFNIKSNMLFKGR